MHRLQTLCSKLQELNDVAERDKAILAQQSKADHNASLQYLQSAQAVASSHERLNTLIQRLVFP